jgi:hypothetical protein
MTKIYALEGAVLSCLTIAYIVARARFSQAPLEDANLIPAAVLGIFALLCATLAQNLERVQRLYFHVVFAFWLSLAYGLLEAFSVGALNVNPLTAAVSLALLTVQVLIAAAAVSETMWSGILWADLSIILVTWYHACLHHGTPPLLTAAVVTCFVNSLSTALLFIRPFYELFPDKVGTDKFSLQQILEILSASLKALAVVIAMAVAYPSGGTTWGLPVILTLPMGFLIRHTVLTPAKAEEAQPQQQEADLQQEEPRTQEQPQRPPPYNQQAFDIHMPTIRPLAQTQRQPFFSPAVLPTTMPAPRLTPDALLFRNTRALINVAKKNS